jgi:uncharacterized protein YcnI
VLPSAASAHVTVTPSYIAAYDTERFVFDSPNEREAPMTGLAVTVPDGFRIVEAGHEPTWHPVVFGRKVTWSGGALAPAKDATFQLELKGPTRPGVVELQAEQLYASGAVVRWPIAFTVIPGTKPSQHLGWAAVAAAAGLLLTVLVVFLAWRRQRVRFAQHE